jgi:hypothetical protein
LVFKSAFKGVIKSGAKFPKWHSCLHYPDFIQEYGIPALTYTGWWEKAHRYLCKLPFLRTGRRTKRLEELMLLRIALAEILRRKEKTLEMADPARQQKSAVAAFERAVSGGRKRRHGASGQASTTQESDYDTQPERAVGRDNDGYVNMEDETYVCR